MIQAILFIHSLLFITTIDPFESGGLSFAQPKLHDDLDVLYILTINDDQPDVLILILKKISSHSIYSMHIMNVNCSVIGIL